MGLGSDVLEIYRELGRHYEVIHDGVVVSQESLLHTTNTQATKPFVLLAHLKVELPYNTMAQGGDILHFIDEGSYYLVTMKQPFIFENEVVHFFSVIYRCNCRVNANHWDADGRDANERKIGHWVPLASNLYGCIADPYQGEEVEKDRDSGEFYGKEIYDLYLPLFSGLKTGVSCWITPTGREEVCLKVTRIKQFVFDGVVEVRVESDGR